MPSHGSGPFDKFVFIDCPDPDNVLMALWVLKNCPNSNVAVVLSIRPVSFRAARYDYAFGRLLEAVGGDIHRLIAAMTEESLREAEQTWLKELSEPDRAWFCVSPDLTDDAVREYTRLYMLVSAFRTAHFWRLHGVAPSRYQIFWNENSLTTNVIGVGMAHAFHVHDWSFSFNDSERLQYEHAVESISDAEGNIVVPISEDYRRRNRDICEAFVQRMAKQENVDDPQHILYDLRSLVTDNMAAGVHAHIFIGGPFADAVTYIKHAPVDRIVAMGWNIRPGSTLFKLQFNVLVAPTSADEFLAHVAAHRLRLTILPTECVKHTVFALTKDELLDVFSSSLPSIRLNLKYHRTAAEGAQQSFALFDLVAALTAHHPDLYPRIPVRAVKMAEPGVVEWVMDAESTIEMFWPDEEHMRRMKPRFLNALRTTVQ